MIYNGPMRFAHRGVAQKAPENTEGAFQAAVDEGYEGIELDIRLSKDGEAIVCHDSHFARLTCGHPSKYCIRHLADMTWEELARIELPYALHLLPEELPPFTENESLATVPWTLLGDYEAAYRTEPRMARLMRFLDFDRWLSRQTRKITVEVEFCAPGLMPRMLEILDASPNKEQYILFSGHRELIDDTTTRIPTSRRRFRSNLWMASIRSAHGMTSTSQWQATAMWNSPSSTPRRTTGTWTSPSMARRNRSPARTPAISRPSIRFP